MRTKQVFMLSLATLIVSVCQASGATIDETVMDQWGAFAQAAVATDSGYYTNYTFDEDGGVGVDAISVFNDDSVPPRGDGRGEASASATLGLSSQLRVKAQGLKDKGVAQAEAVAIEGFSYNGYLSQDYSITVTLDATVSGGAESFVQADIYVFDAMSDFFFTTIADDLLYEPAAVPVKAEAHFYVDQDTTTIDPVTLDFTLEPMGTGNSDDVYLWINLKAEAVDAGALADAWNTLNANFTSGDTGMLTVASNVPEPATLGLLTLGGLAMLRRQKR